MSKKNYRYGCNCSFIIPGRLCAVCLAAEDLESNREFIGYREIPDTEPLVKKQTETSGFALVGRDGDKAILVLTVDDHEGEVLMDRVTWEQVARNMAWR